MNNTPADVWTRSPPPSNAPPPYALASCAAPSRGAGAALVNPRPASDRRRATPAGPAGSAGAGGGMPSRASRLPGFGSASHGLRRRRGTILVVVLLIVVALTGMTLVLCRAARVEALASANHVSSAQAAAVARGAEQYAVALIAQQGASTEPLPETYFQAVPVGEAGYFWVVRPDYNDPNLPLYGLVDEASKLNLNSATADMLNRLSGLPPELPGSILDWRDADAEVAPDGAENQHYLALANPYRCKNGPLETVEELLLIRGAYPELLYGYSNASNAGGGGTPGVPTDIGGGRSTGGFGSAAFGDQVLAHGLQHYVTVYSREQQQAGGRQLIRIGRINVFTAPREVLLCLPGLDESDVDKLTSQRATAAGSTATGTGSTGTGTGTGTGAGGQQSNPLGWVVQALGTKAGPVLPLLTSRSSQYSAEIVAASADGRAYRRTRIVIDATNAVAPRIVYRRDLTEQGWPLDLQILASLRRRERPGAVTGLGLSGAGGRMR